VKREPVHGQFMYGHRRVGAVAAVVALLVLVATMQLALRSGPPLSTPDARAHVIGERLACPICAGLSVADSPSALATQMRVVIVDQIAAGQSNAQIEQYFVARYGPAILLTPPKQGFTLLAWWGPIVFLLASALGIGIAAFRWSRQQSPEGVMSELSPDEERRYGERVAAELPGVDEHVGVG